MAEFKCKMCGGNIEFEPGADIGVCDSCGTKQTLPKLNDEKIRNLYDRANHFRRNNEFDKAAALYEQILSEDPSDAEVYWSLVLCRYGIEYVEDPVTHKRIPTVNRTQYTSIFDDPDYKQALEHANSEQRALYEKEAEQINDIQKGILAISGQEEPFDVFICYKETDEAGRRTPDSVLANDIYHQLTNAGFRVFYSRITLEDKLGQEYEPYIFAALNSSKVMVVLGTKPQYFNAVWVKNEWSRFLSLIKQGEHKTLIPCYKDMDPYDLPEEFSHLQALDMSQIGFMPDLIRGIKKIIGDDNSARQTQGAAPAESSNTGALLKRAFMFLEDGDFGKASEYAEKVLDNDPENGRAYLALFMSVNRIRNEEDIKDFDKLNAFEDNMFDALEPQIKSAYLRENNYAGAKIELLRKAYQYGDNKLKSEIDGYVDYNKEKTYENAKKLMAEGSRENSSEKALNLYQKAYIEFGKYSGYKDCGRLCKECLNKIGQLNDALKHEDKLYSDKYKKAASELRSAEKLFSESKEKKTAPNLPRIIHNFETAEHLYSEMGSYKDSAELLEQCRKTLTGLREEQYNKAKALAQNPANLNNAVSALGCLAGYKDADALKKEWKKEAELYSTYENAKNSARSDNPEDLLRAADAFKSLGNFKDSERLARECEDKAEKFKKQNEEEKEKRSRNTKKFIKIAIITGAVCAAILLIISIVTPLNNYKEAEEMLTAGNISGAAIKFGAAGNYQDAKERSLAAWDTIVDRKITLLAGPGYTVGLKSDGTVIAVGNNNDGQCDVEKWTDIVSVSAGGNNTVGLKSDGTVVVVGDNNDGQCDVENWTDIVSVSAGGNNTVGLKSDGTVVVVGDNNDGQCDVENWTDIVAISAGSDHTLGLKSDGTVVAIGGNDHGECNVGNWTDIIAISTTSGHTVGLKSDGTVIAVGSNSDGQCDVGNWTDIAAISAGSGYTVGLKSDGTVVAVGSNEDGQCNVESWTDIIAISAGRAHTVGLKSDGTVIAVGDNDSGECDVGDWSDIIDVATGTDYTVGLKSDGTVVAVGGNYDGQCDVESWRDIVNVSAGMYNTVGLKSDGTVVAVGDNDDGQCDVENWTDIVDVSAGVRHTIGLKSDGTVVAVGSNYYGGCDVESWRDIVNVSAGMYNTVGLKSDGTVIAVGNNDWGQCDVGRWTDIVDVSAADTYIVGLKSHGTVVAVGDNYDGQCDVENWTDIVAISAGYNHTVGLKSDGTVVAVGDNDYGQCDVENWTDIVDVSAGVRYTVGLKSDGSVVAVGENNAGECNVGDWSDIMLPS